MNKVLELFGTPVGARRVDWAEVVDAQQCPFTGAGCSKHRKSEAAVKIGTCTVDYDGPVIICPERLLERQRQVFRDCVPLLRRHGPGHELHVIPELSVPGGSVDFVLASVAGGRIADFVAIEFQTLDTSGTVWPERQRLLRSLGLPVKAADAGSPSKFGMNWKMTAKTILVQLHHKIETFEQLGKRLVLVVQDRLLAYMQAEFAFGHLRAADPADSMHFHAYAMRGDGRGLTLELAHQLSTDAAGVARALASQGSTAVELEVLVSTLERRLSAKTKL